MQYLLPIVGQAGGYVAGMNVAQTGIVLLAITAINSAISVLAGTVIIGQGVYFGGRLIYRVIETSTGFLVEKINNLRETRELTHSTVEIDGEEYELLEDKREIVEINIKEFTMDKFNALDPHKLYRFIGIPNAT